MRPEKGRYAGLPAPAKTHGSGEFLSDRRESKERRRGHPAAALEAADVRPARHYSRPCAAHESCGGTRSGETRAPGPCRHRVRRRQESALTHQVLVVLALLVWWAVAAFAGSGQASAENDSPAPAASSASAPASRGALPLEGVSPLDFQLRDCFKDFDPDAQQSTVVDCATGHSAQLVAVEKYGADDSYPGRDQLKQKARDACKAAPLTAKAGDYDLSYKLAYPSPRSWEMGDRRVDCYAATNGGNVIKESLLP